MNEFLMKSANICTMSNRNELNFWFEEFFINGELIFFRKGARRFVQKYQIRFLQKNSSKHQFLLFSNWQKIFPSIFVIKAPDNFLQFCMAEGIFLMVLTLIVMSYIKIWIFNWNTNLVFHMNRSIDYTNCI